MTTDTTANTGELFVALISFVPPASARDAGQFAPFDTIDAARQWADEQLRADVGRSGSAWNFRADVARVTRADFDADTWGVDNDNTATRATWNVETATVVWQDNGPFEFGDWSDEFEYDECDDSDM
ncbi:hypothetical protein GPX89_07625 [Nocardia sp. ET3-3]|uniref:Uncharacterized protein n=1 Tax=Nocardia terrae TaxID=2675851 RepID=A0A7K1URZ8_9NOCA|nr:hypothetical protein [Nocardia terrae]MVU77116.1 hypothetical protein [Nocardia terrae]